MRGDGGGKGGMVLEWKNEEDIYIYIVHSGHDILSYPIDSSSSTPQ